jgi:hypothetical protein
MIKLAFLLWGGGERKDENREVGSHAANSSRVPKYFVRVLYGP